MKILLGCYHTTRLKEAIRQNGHEVHSCDLKSSVSSADHYQCDILELLPGNYDLLICFPPCTYLAKAQYSRTAHCKQRQQKRNDAALFAFQLYYSGVPRIALENPIGYLSKVLGNPQQIVRPYHFGDPYNKDVCLWLKNMPPLISTVFNPVRKSISNHVNSRMSQVQKSEIKSSWNYFPGMCQAIADQWCPPEKVSLDKTKLEYVRS